MVRIIRIGGEDMKLELARFVARTLLLREVLSGPFVQFNVLIRLDGKGKYAVNVESLYIQVMCIAAIVEQYITRLLGENIFANYVGKKYPLIEYIVAYARQEAKVRLLLIAKYAGNPLNIGKAMIVSSVQGNAMLNSSTVKVIQIGKVVD